MCMPYLAHSLSKNALKKAKREAKKAEKRAKGQARAVCVITRRAVYMGSHGGRSSRRLRRLGPMCPATSTATAPSCKAQPDQVTQFCRICCICCPDSCDVGKKFVELFKLSAANVGETMTIRARLHSLRAVGKSRISHLEK